MSDLTDLGHAAAVLAAAFIRCRGHDMSETDAAKLYFDCLHSLHEERRRRNDKGGTRSEQR